MQAQGLMKKYLAREIKFKITMNILSNLFYLIATMNIPIVLGILPETINKILKKGKIKRPRNCSIHQSAIVRNVLEENFYPIYEKYGFEVPHKCKLHKSRDTFSWIEGNKTDEGVSMKCEICGKHFYEQYHLYEHAKRKHKDAFLTGDNTVCLADYCDIFRCDLHQRYPHNIPKSISCDKKNVDTLRRKCEALARSCLPDKMQHLIYDKIYTSLCSTLTCEKFLHPFQDSVSVLTVVSLSLLIPVALFIIFNVCLIWWENIDDPDGDEDFIRKKRAEYDGKNAVYDKRFYAVRERGYNIRNRSKNQYTKVSRYPR